MKSSHSERKRKLRSVMGVAALRSGLVAAATLPGLFSLPVCAQKTAPPAPVVVQPGAPGKPTQTLPPSTRATLPPSSPADVQFMQGPNAEGMLRRATQMDPNNFSAHHLLAQVLQRANRPEEAKREFETAEKLRTSADKQQ